MVGTAFHLSFLFPSALLHSNCDSSKCAFKMMKIPCTSAGDYHHYLKNVHKWTNLACSCQTYHLGSLQIISILISSRSESTRTKSALADITTRIYCTVVREKHDKRYGIYVPRTGAHMAMLSSSCDLL